jgi:hypothetical protein
VKASFLVKVPEEMALVVILRTFVHLMRMMWYLCGGSLHLHDENEMMCISKPHEGFTVVILNRQQLLRHFEGF